ncbi:hypothetical protein FIBSPDRAFT_945003 [Athelia psychrophila]|uniref:Uncharacterized protein n=1 Tax=Athelia psychrophila TaxID=1759441 RepID=A0A166U9P7_9AGAM|nr:hypothetical protein FIBSPDRAFT_945003 [Fibularhizoctonia sp. CBS 109695]
MPSRTLAHPQAALQANPDVPSKLELIFTVGRDGGPILFKEDIPALLCQRDCPRDLSSRRVSNLVDTLEMEVLSRHAEWRLGGASCLYCGKPAMCLHTAVMITLHADPPTMRVPAQPLCSKKNDRKCALAAQKTFADGMNDLNGPCLEDGAEVYQV